LLREGPLSFVGARHCLAFSAGGGKWRAPNGSSTVRGAPGVLSFRTWKIRLDPRPEVPTLQEAGFKGPCHRVMVRCVCAVGTPAIVARLNAEMTWRSPMPQRARACSRRRPGQSAAVRSNSLASLTRIRKSTHALSKSSTSRPVSARSFDHLIGAQQERGWKRDPECLG
jgi:hypothetical protein